MLRAYKVEIKPTVEQKIKMAQTFGVCRYGYNFYIRHNQERHKNGEKRMTGYDFSKWLNNEFFPNNPSYGWAKDVGSKAVKNSIMNAEKTYKKFLKGETNKLKFKSKSSRKSFYFPCNSEKDLAIERHRGRIPTLGFIRFKEFGYVPEGYEAKSVTVTLKAGHYYASYLFEVEPEKRQGVITEPIGIDLGIKDLAIVSDGKVFKNINKTARVKKLEKKLKRKQRVFSRKLEKNKKGKNIIYTANMRKDKLNIGKLYQRLSNIRTEYIRHTVNSLVKANSLPAYVSIEDLNIDGMRRNKHLSDAISKQKLGYFRAYLTQRCCKYEDAELRAINRFYPSSKMCNKCGCIKSTLKLSERTYICPECGNIDDRDNNASKNIRDCSTYEIAS